METFIQENLEIIIAALASLGGVVSYFVLKSRKEPVVSDHIESKESGEEKKIETPAGPTWAQRLSKGLEKSRQDVWGKIGELFGGEKANLDEIEEILYSADIPTSYVQSLLEKLESEGKGKSSEEIQTLVFDFLDKKMSPVQEKLTEDLFHFKANSGTKVFMIVGVNGAGKTTTIGKLATKLNKQGAKVIVGACDTFRAAAVDQLQVWCERAGVDMVRAKDGADPSGVAYDTVAKAYAENYDYCLIDTAGRLHTNQNLMDELAKTKRVMSKINAEAPHQVLLVLDAITGQNALKQAQEFNKALNLSGIIFTKCDGSAKAGSAVAIVDELQVPITYIGVGEGVEDLHHFDKNLYLKTLIGLD
ncbi:MAG TPA: signal recognition particle-docking protein FtsY [Bacteriovoracaceae bacterium]|nr:signal recognition particle-docking protein FtsY [Bacteriovoracaceae bacterium]